MSRFRSISTGAITIALGVLVFSTSASSALSSSPLVVRPYHGGLKITLVGHRGPTVLIFDWKRVAVRRSAPYDFSVGARLLNKPYRRHRVAVRNARTGELLALEYIRSGSIRPVPRQEAPLTWAPPRLVHPTTINITSPSRSLSLDPAKDYILKMPSTPVKPGSDGGLWVKGGHNIVIVGGEFDFTGVVNTSSSEDEGRVATFFDVTGTVHMEGIYAHGGGLIEGVQMYSPQATLQLENCRFEHLRTQTAAYHSDLVQWGSGKELRVDRFTGSTEVQGISSFGASGVFSLKHVNILGHSGSRDSSPVLLWLQTSAVTLQDVYVQPRPGEPFSWTLRPTGGVLSGQGTMTWPRSTVSGSVRSGNPPSGDFAPAGLPGIRYTSPGYR
jgi:hypothetical protein